MMLRCALSTCLFVLSSHAQESVPREIVQPVQVILSVGPDGVPYHLSAEVGLPHATVEDLRARKFEVRPQPYGLGMTIEVARSPQRLRSPELSRAENASHNKEAAKWDLKKALDLDAKIKPTEVRMEDRSMLLSYAAAHSTDAQARAIRARQLAWLIQNRPTENVLHSPVALVPKSAEPETYQQLSTLWLDAVKKQPGTAGLLINASYFFRLADPEQVESMLGGTKLAMTAPELGETDALAALGVASLHPQTGAPEALDAGTPKARAARDRLIQSRDYARTSAAYSVLRKFEAALAAQSKLPAEFATLCETLKQRQARTSDDNQDSGCNFESPEQQNPKVTRGGIRSQARPVYPLDARAKGIAGLVELDAFINKTGDVEQIELRRGPLALYNAARDAVGQWKYNPYLLNGKPVEVITELDVNFALQ